MNEKEIAELRRRFRPEKSCISRIRGCCVNEKKELVSEFDQPLGMLPEQEAESLLAILKKTLSGKRGRTLSGKLDYVAQSVNPKTSTRLMRVRLDEGSGLLPGDFVHVDLQIGVRENAVRIPQKAVRQEPDGTYTVFVYQDGKARLRPVKLDRWDGPDWIATSGLATGDRVITNQLLKLRDGSAVQPAEASKTAK